MFPNNEYIKTVINAISTKIGGLSKIANDAILKTKQILTEDEQKIARDNIAAASASRAGVFTCTAKMVGNGGGLITPYSQVVDAMKANQYVRLKAGNIFYPLLTGSAEKLVFGDGIYTYTVTPDLVINRNESEPASNVLTKKMQILSSNERAQVRANIEAAKEETVVHMTGYTLNGGRVNLDKNYNEIWNLIYSDFKKIVVTNSDIKLYFKYNRNGNLYFAGQSGDICGYLVIGSNGSTYYQYSVLDAIAGSYSNITWINNTRISPSSGAVETDNNCRCSDYLEIDPNSVLIFINDRADYTNYNCWYDASKTRISSFSNYSGRVIAPSNARYFRVTTGKITDTFMIVRGDVNSRLDAINRSIPKDYFASTDALPQHAMSADPTEDMQIATKQYVDDSIPTQTIQKIESTDQSNMVSIRSIDSGIYILYGYFKPYAGADLMMAFSSNLLVSILKGDTESHIQVFYPHNNCVQYLKITDSSYERKDTYLNNLMSKSDDMVISSSTEGSTKKFKITVDDTGALTATEVITS